MNYQDKSIKTKAIGVTYLNGLLTIHLDHGGFLVIPKNKIESLEKVEDASLRRLEICKHGKYIYIIDVNLSLSVAHLLLGILGTDAWIEKIKHSKKK